jgi:hypothetical protein
VITDTPRRPQPDPSRALPWQVAARWGNPTYGSEEGPDLLSRVTTARAVLGMLSLIAVGLYTGTRGPGQVLTEEGWDKTSLSVVIAVGLVPALMVGTYSVTRSGHRRSLRWGPTIWRILLMAASTYAVMTPIILSGMDIFPGAWGPLLAAAEMELIGLVAVVMSGARGGTIFVLGILLGVVTGFLWVIFYVLSVAFWASRTSCWAGKFHPLLAPAVSAVLVVYFTVVALIDQDTKGVPMDLWLVLTLGGLVTTLALAITEHESLRRRGYSWRSGPTPMRD